MGILDAPAPRPSQAQKYQRGLVPCVTRVHASMSFQDAGAGISNGTDTSSYQRLRVAVTTAVSDLRMVLGNYYWGQVDNLTQITVTAAIETTTASYPLTFNGKAAVVLDPGASLTSDPGCVPITVQKGDSLWLRTYVTVGAGGKWPQSVYYWQLADDRVSTTSGDLTSATGSGGATLAALYVRAFAPAAILGTPVNPTQPVFAIWGDSELVSLNDTLVDFFRGWAERALNGNYSYVNVSRHSSHVSQMLPSPAAGSFSLFKPLDYAQRWRLAAGCTHAFSGFGVNDIASDALSVVQANLVTHWTELATRGMKVWQYTLPPRTTSTDGWMTLGNQTVTNIETSRVTLNDWFRAGAPINATTKAPVAVGTSGALVASQAGHPLKGYVETADSWESARNSGKWRVPERSITDATIGTQTVILTSPTANFTAADVGKSVAIAGAGTSGAPLITSITTFTNTTTVRLLNAAVTGVSGVNAGIGCYTGDGLHPDKTGHVAAGTAVAAVIPTIAAT